MDFERQTGNICHRFSTATNCDVHSSIKKDRQQRANKVMSTSPGLVDSILYLPNKQVKVFGKMFEEIQITEVL